MDLRLRPYGESGPVVASLAMLEQYFSYETKVELYAWIKAHAALVKLLQA
jgi:glutamate-ammonia-ligase adenylyltransferase